jgi:hypothetical protein
MWCNHERRGTFVYNCIFLMTLIMDSNPNVLIKWFRYSTPIFRHDGDLYFETHTQAYCWGEDTNGKNGNGKAGGFYAAPTKVVGGISWTV